MNTKTTNIKCRSEAALSAAEESLERGMGRAAGNGLNPKRIKRIWSRPRMPRPVCRAEQREAPWRGD